MMMFKRLVCFAKSLGASHHDAEDLAQETLIKSITHAHQFTGNSGQRLAWMYTILRYKYYSLYRHNKIVAQAMAEESEAVDGNQESSYDADVIRARVQATGCEVLEDWLDGLQLEEIAARRSIPLGTVKSRIFRAREKLAQV